ncbi:MULTISPECIES: hypothetical protein [unclassified Legionella]|uniref:hypothetical protein n=1 Tax=unclassified Legionella TaxID=2622702 RepID=UPI001056B913|nr:MULTISPECIES: hypothetical protein [unclassified Legionella]MDI9817546.1 hypothetical protein [Legionella sp. PL877]
MKLSFNLLMYFLSAPAFAGKIPFKEAIEPKQGWFSYVLAILALLAIGLVLMKKNNPIASKQSLCKILDKKHLGNKTVVYVIEYKNQGFLVADNQQALALHALPKENDHEV